ncbi:hypothetical protein Hanom_Chr01g00075151 [Helianthus anomalus]
MIFTYQTVKLHFIFCSAQVGSIWTMVCKCDHPYSILFFNSTLLCVKRVVYNFCNLKLFYMNRMASTLHIQPYFPPRRKIFSAATRGRNT